ncbi:unknown [Crocosphaera subtropica ATCC 51142]|uniref:Calcium-binding protein n=1 Tax=Crocosphaera subtropica (strain ATCC 51142 / BH68) TaxID=43989 RepID=B1X2Q7_CROS5|nr:calcium-binding protein [Crocosphaera subtropica]ACB54418.1 unknown [Crocosphaera subtropica ATCC 51142]
MATTPHDDEREQRISNEIIVDAYNSDEERMGWYCYLEDNLSLPFVAIWDEQTVEVVGISDEDECRKEMRVDIRYSEKNRQDVFSVSLSEINPVDTDETTNEAIADWKYWVGRGYEFSEGEEDVFF